MIYFIKCLGEIQSAQIDGAASIYEACDDISSGIYGLGTANAFIKAKLIIITAELTFIAI